MTLLVSASSSTTSLASNASRRNYRFNGSSTPCCLSGLFMKEMNPGKSFAFVCLVAKSRNRPISESQGRIYDKMARETSPPPMISEGREEDDTLAAICPGCGIYMQNKDPNLPGYYKERAFNDDMVEVVDEEEIDFELEAAEDEFERVDVSEGNEWLPDANDDIYKDLNGFATAGVGYGNVTEEVLERERLRKEKKKQSKAEKKRMARESKRGQEEIRVCARCHCLRNYGQIKNEAVENLIPDFDFDRLVASRLIAQIGNGSPTVVILVVDCVDFDGSFPRKAAMSLLSIQTEADRRGKKSSLKIVLVATKVDLLPSQVSPTRLDRWVRHRARAHGVPKLSAVYLVSARKDLGVRNLLSFIKEIAGPRGNVWVVGAQNAGKSTLINSLARKETKLTEASIPGTTIGILRIGGILSAKAKMYDTPGLLHPYLLCMRLNREEQKMVEIRKELKPRTYRAKAGQAVHVGGLCRVDVKHSSVETIYITVWASQSVSLHLGKVESADELMSNQLGIRLQPPVGRERGSQLGKWVEKEIKAKGGSWEYNSIDIAIAGMGWFSIGLKGDATLALWVYEGVEVSIRDPLVLDRARFLERPGFWFPKAVSESVGKLTKMQSLEMTVESGNA